MAQKKDKEQYGRSWAPDCEFKVYELNNNEDCGASIAIGEFYYETDSYKDKQDAIDEQQGCLLAIKEQMACDWIFERYGICIEPIWCFFLKGQPWDCSISDTSIGTKWIGNALRKTCKSQEEAIDEAILYVLNNFKQKEQE